MSTALIERDPPAATAADKALDSIDTWLAVLVRLLHVAPGQREAIRDEIEAHLRERVRDLMIAGAAEHDAIRTAISELGEVADLAHRFSHASKLRMRRTIMNIAVLGVGAVGIATATIMFNGPPQGDSRLSVFQPPTTASADAAASALNDRTVPASFAGHELGQVLQYLAEAAGFDLIVDHRSLENAGVSLDDKVTLHLSSPRPIAQVLDLVSAHLQDPFAWRAADGILEISTADVFDRREIVLASFDVQSALDLIWSETSDMEQAAQRLEALMIEYVEPDAWQVNGGDLANVSVVGGKMFVKAPVRFHEPIQWILGQLEESAVARASRPPGTASGFGDGGASSGGRVGWTPSSHSTLFGSRASTAAPSGAGGARRFNGLNTSPESTLLPSTFNRTSTAPGGLFSGAGGTMTTQPAAPGAAPGVPAQAAPPPGSAAPAPVSKPATEPIPAPVEKPATETIPAPEEKPAESAAGGGK